MKLPWKYILVSLMIGLFLGAATGIFTARCLHSRWMKPSPERLLQRFNKELNLTEPQRAGILGILNTHREKMDAQRQAIRQAARAEIRKLLTPDQQVRFDALEARRDAERQKRWGQ